MSVFDLHLNSSLHNPLTHSRSEPLGSRLYHALLRRLDEWKQRRELIALLELDDAVLEDMGVLRGELIEAIELPLSEDAYTTLRQWRAERHLRG